MNKTILSFILTFFSFSSMIVGIEDVCNSLAWRLFIGIVALGLLAYSFILYKKNADRSLIFTAAAAAVVLVVTVIVDYNTYEKSRRNATLYHNYLQEKNSNSSFTPLERKALIDNDATAQLKLANNYLYGNNGYQLDYQKARDFAQRSADQGFADAHDFLANIYLKGRGCEPDTARAVSNMIQALKEGNLGLSKYLISFDIGSMHLSRKDSLLVADCYHSALYLDSLCSSCTKSTGQLDNDLFDRTMKEQKKQILRLADNGYPFAVELLFFDALINNRTVECHQYSVQLNEMGRIPDLPVMRGFFYDALLGPDYQKWKTEEEYVEKHIDNQDFMGLGIEWEYISLDNLKNPILRYKYNLAQFKRAQYLREYSDYIYTPAVTFNEDVEKEYLFAKNCLVISTNQLASEMISQPFVFSR